MIYELTRFAKHLQIQMQKVNQNNENEKSNEEVKLDFKIKTLWWIFRLKKFRATLTEEKDTLRSVLDDWTCYARLVGRKLI